MLIDAFRPKPAGRGSKPGRNSRSEARENVALCHPASKIQFQFSLQGQAQTLLQCHLQTPSSRGKSSQVGLVCSSWRGRRHRQAGAKKDAVPPKDRHKHILAKARRPSGAKGGRLPTPTERALCVWGGGGRVIDISRDLKKANDPLGLLRTASTTIHTKRNRTSGEVGAPADGPIVPGATGPLVAPSIVGETTACGELVGVVAGGPVVGGSVTVVGDG